MEVDLSLKKCVESCKQTEVSMKAPLPMTEAKNDDSNQHSESTVSLGSLFASSSQESPDAKEDLKSYAADSEGETDHEDFDFVSPVHLSSPSLSWNLDDLPR